MLYFTSASKLSLIWCFPSRVALISFHIEEPKKNQPTNQKPYEKRRKAQKKCYSDWSNTSSCTFLPTPAIIYYSVRQMRERGDCQKQMKENKFRHTWNTSKRPFALLHHIHSPPNIRMSLIKLKGPSSSRSIFGWKILTEHDVMSANRRRYSLCKINFSMPLEDDDWKREKRCLKDDDEFKL